MASGAEIRAALADQLETTFSCRYGESDLDIQAEVRAAEDDLDYCMRGGFVVYSCIEYNKKKPTSKDLPRRKRRKF